MPGRRLHGFQRDLQLHQHDVGFVHGADLDVGRHDPASGARRDDDQVLAAAVLDSNCCRPGGHIVGDEHRRGQHASVGEIGNEPPADGVIADPSHHGDISAQRAGRGGLIGALAARACRGARADHGLAAAGQLLHADDEIEVQAADDGDRGRHLPSLPQHSGALPAGIALPRVATLASDSRAYAGQSGRAPNLVRRS